MPRLERIYPTNLLPEIQQQVRETAMHADLQYLRREILKHIDIAPVAAQAVRRFSAAVDDFYDLKIQLKTNQKIQEMIDGRPQVFLAVYQGAFAEVVESFLRIKRASEAFLANENNHPSHPNLRKRMKNAAMFREYEMKYTKVGRLVASFLPGIHSYQPLWMNEPLPANVFSDQNEIASAGGETYGEVYVEFVNDFAQTKHEMLSMGELEDLLDVFIACLRREEMKSSVLTLGIPVEKQTLARMFFDYILMDRQNVTIKDLSHFPKNVKEMFLRGSKSLEVFRSFFSLIPTVLTDPEHPLHAKVIQFLTVMNSFSMPALPNDEGMVFGDQTFTSLYCELLIYSDYNLITDFTKLMLKLKELSEQEGPNQEWYQQFFTVLYQKNAHLPTKIALECRDTSEVFLPVKDVPSVPDYAAVLDQIFEANNTTELSWHYSHDVVLPEEIGLRGDAFFCRVNLEKLGANVSEVQVETAVVHIDPENENNKYTIKFKMMAHVRQDGVELYIPILDPENSGQLLLTAGTYFVRLINTLYSEYSQLSDETQTKVRTTLPNRADRLAAYTAKSKDDTPQTQKYTGAVRSTLYVDNTLAEEVARNILPDAIEISEVVRREINKKEKKGASARIHQEADQFVADYNAAEKGKKPGKGIQVTDVFGPNGEKVWRFKPTYHTRCLIVDLSDGRGLLIHVDDREDIYDKATSLRKLVSREVHKHYNR
jgi:hypothetical protein